MSQEFKKKLATVFVEKGVHRVMMPSGEVIPHDIQTITKSRVDINEVTVTFLCNVVNSKEEALKIYQKTE